MAGSDSQKQLLTLIRDYATEKSHGGDLLSSLSFVLIFCFFGWKCIRLLSHSGDAQKNAE